MRRKILSALGCAAIVGALVAAPTPAGAARQEAIIVDALSPKFSKSYPALTGFTTHVHFPGFREDIPDVGDQELGEVAVSEGEHPGTVVVGDQGQSFPRCSGVTTTNRPPFPWCDTMELVIKNVPKNSIGKYTYGLEILLTWPGPGTVDPVSKREIKKNNLDFYLYVQTFEAWEFEDEGTTLRQARANGLNDEFPEEPRSTVRFNALTVPKLSRTKFHPERLVLADAPPSGEHVPLELYKEAPLGGADSFENTYDANGNGYADVPKCPQSVMEGPNQRDLCPRIVDHYNTFNYFLLVINRAAAGTPVENTVNQGYTISSELTDLVFESFGDGSSVDSGGFTPDPDATFDFDDFTPPVEGLKPVKEPGTDGPEATFDLLALKGQTKGPEQQSELGLISGVLLLLLLAFLIFAFLFYIKRRRRGTAET